MVKHGGYCRLLKNQRDMPHGYIELAEPVEARYIRYEHVLLHQ